MSKVKICPKCGKANYTMMTECKECNTSLEGVEVKTISDTGQVIETNAVASMLKIIGIITYIAAFICGILASRAYFGEMILEVVLPYWIVGMVLGSVLLGFSEIVRLLHEINQKK